MNPLRQAATRLNKPVLRSQAFTRTLTTTPRTAAAAATKGDHASDHAHHEGHDSHYDPPGGWLWGLRPGEKAPKEGWEYPFYAMVAGLMVATVAYTMKEDTSIQTWALEEARRRLEKEGLLEDPDNKS